MCPVHQCENGDGMWVEKERSAPLAESTSFLHPLFYIVTSGGPFLAPIHRKLDGSFRLEHVTNSRQ